MSRKTDQEASFIVFLLLVIVVIIFAVISLLNYIVNWTVNWIGQNWIIAGLGIIAIGIIAGVLFLIKSQVEKRKIEEKNRLAEERERVLKEKEKLEEEEKNRLAEEREKFESEQKEKGLIKFLDADNNEKWGTSEEIEKWIKDDEEAKIKNLLINRIVQSIKNFQPTRKWPDEDSYHKELLGYLKVEYPDIKYEFQTGSSRPDLVIRNVAIEIKGPTDNNALDTLTTKCLKYSHYFDHLIMVLFDPQFSERHFKEVESGIHQYFPHVVIIRK